MTSTHERAGAVAIQRVGLRELPAVVPLFDAYRQFYGLPSDPIAAATFLSERVRRRQSLILLARITSAGHLRPAGFAQLYASFSSLSMAPIVVLNDLFVDPSARGQGVGAELLRASIEHARSTGACRLELATASTNETARRLYVAHGFTVDRDFDHMSLALGETVVPEGDRG